MRENRSRQDEPVRTRILFHALVGALAISASLILGESEVESQRTGALLLLLSGMLFAVVVVIDSARALRGQAAGPEQPTPPRTASGRDRPREPVTRRIRQAPAGRVAEVRRQSSL